MLSWQIRASPGAPWKRPGPRDRRNGEIEARLDGSVSVENILKAARDPDRPKIKRISKVQKRLDALTEAVRRRAIDEAVGLVQTWESEVQQKEA